MGEADPSDILRHTLEEEDGEEWFGIDPDGVEFMWSYDNCESNYDETYPYEEIDDNEKKDSDEGDGE